MRETFERQTIFDLYRRVFGIEKVSVLFCNFDRFAYVKTTKLINLLDKFPLTVKTVNFWYVFILTDDSCHLKMINLTAVKIQNQDVKCQFSQLSESSLILTDNHYCVFSPFSL